MTELTSLTLAQARDALRRKEFSASELADEHLAAIEQARALNAFVLETPERARDMARAADARLAKGEGGPLEGLPLGIKDLFCTEGVRTTACSHILENFVPPYESTVTANLWRDGAVLLGKLNNDEFAMGSSTETSYFGPAVSPWRRRGADAKLVPGGSSGGSAAAVAANLCVGATGTDTGGSIRQPASFCGVSGVTPTYGRVSRYGLTAFASSLDHIGPFARTVKDAARVLGVIAGRDPRDSTSAEAPVPDYTKALDGNVKGLKLGLPREYLKDMTSESGNLMNRGVEVLRQLGCEVREIGLPHTDYAIASYYIIATAEASSNLARYDGVRYTFRSAESATLADMYRNTRGEGFGAECKRRIMLGTYVLSAGYYDAYYLKAQKVRGLIARDFERAFEEVDAVVAPVSPFPAFRLGEKVDDPLAMYLSDIFTITGSLAGIPCMSVPCGRTSEGLPVGMQILTRHFGEVTMFRIADAFEKAGGVN